MQIVPMSADEIDVVLRAQTLARFACQEDGRPYIVPIRYAFDGEAIVVHSVEGRKLRIMRENPRVCFQVDAIDGPTTWSVIGWGDCEELRGEEAREALRSLIDRLLPPGAAFSGSDPFAPPGLEDRVVMFRVKLTARSGRAARP